MQGRLALLGVTTQLGVALRAYTTLRLGGPARLLSTADSTESLVDIVRAADAAGEPALVLGGGSNLVIGDDGFDGTVIRVASRGYTISRGGALTVAAGEDWDEVVARTIADGFGGLECLSGIPGLVGAVPVQNVGAYGVEIGQLLDGVRLLDRGQGVVRAVPVVELGLGYRTSALKGRDSAVVLQMAARLRPDGLSMPVRYPELAKVLGVALGSQLPAAEVRAAVLYLRRGKGMVLDATDHDTWSAGSFFTNPVVAADALPAVLAAARSRLGPQVLPPQYPAAGGMTKLSAAWLIERAGFGKGHAGPGGRVALSGKHTLALTNRGSASTADLLALAREVVAGVRSAFGVVLCPEPVLVNCAL